MHRYDFDLSATVRLRELIADYGRMRRLVLAAYLSAHRTMSNGSALCAALAVTERD